MFVIIVTVIILIRNISSFHVFPLPLTSFSLLFLPGTASFILLPTSLPYIFYLPYSTSYFGLPHPPVPMPLTYRDVMLGRISCQVWASKSTGDALDGTE